MQWRPKVESISSEPHRTFLTVCSYFFLYMETLILNNISIENNLSTAHVVFPVPLRPIANTFPFSPITSFSCSVKLILKLGILVSSYTKTLALWKSTNLLISESLICFWYSAIFFLSIKLRWSFESHLLILLSKIIVDISDDDM